MAVKLALLKSGEQVIADIKELINDDGRVVTLVFTNPYVVQFLTAELLYEEVSNEIEEINHRVSFSPWMPLSVDKNIAVPTDWVVTIVEANEWIKSSYEQKMDSTTEGVVNKELPISPEYQNLEVITEEKDE
jgi:hypothetical protein